MVPILMNKDVFELSYNDLKFTLKPQLLLQQPNISSIFYLQVWFSFTVIASITIPFLDHSLVTAEEFP